MAEILIFS